MKIIKYKVPGIVKKEGSEVLLILDEENKVEYGRPQEVDVPANEIPNVAKRLADENDTQRTLAKGTLLGNEREEKVTVYLSYLQD